MSLENKAVAIHQIEMYYKDAAFSSFCKMIPFFRHLDPMRSPANAGVMPRTVPRTVSGGALSRPSAGKPLLDKFNKKMTPEQRRLLEACARHEQERKSVTVADALGPAVAFKKYKQ